MKEQRHFPKESRNPERDRKIRMQWMLVGTTLDKLAKAHNLTGARIHQIIHGRAASRAMGATEEWYGES